LYLLSLLMLIIHDFLQNSEPIKLILSIFKT